MVNVLYCHQNNLTMQKKTVYGPKIGLFFTLLKLFSFLLDFGVV